MPLNPFARSLANLESVIGPFYLAITVARLVTMELEDRRRSRPLASDGRLGGVLARWRPPSASPSSRRMPEPNTGDRPSHGSRVDEFRTAKLRRGSPDVCPRLGTARMIEDCYDFPMGSDF